MKPIWKAFVCGCVFLLLVQHLALAQFNVPKYQLGAGIGTFVYMGDLTPSAAGSYRTLQPAVSLFAAKLMSPSLAFRANLSLGRLKGDDAKYSHPEYRQQRNFMFHARVTELSALAEWNPLGKNYVSRGFAPYVFGGAAYSFLRVRPDASRFNAAYFGDGSPILAGLTADAQHGTPSGVFSIPVGAGVRYYVSDKIGVGAEASYRLMSTDYLDGFSQAANPTKNDHYGLYTVGAVYRLGKKNMLDCPKMRY